MKAILMFNANTNCTLISEVKKVWNLSPYLSMLCICF